MRKVLIALCNLIFLFGFFAFFAVHIYAACGQWGDTCTQSPDSCCAKGIYPADNNLYKLSCQQDNTGQGLLCQTTGNSLGLPPNTPTPNGSNGLSCRDKPDSNGSYNYQGTCASGATCTGGSISDNFGTISGGVCTAGTCGAPGTSCNALNMGMANQDTVQGSCCSGSLCKGGNFDQNHAAQLGGTCSGTKACGTDKNGIKCTTNDPQDVEGSCCQNFDCKGTQPDASNKNGGGKDGTCSPHVNANQTCSANVSDPQGNCMSGYTCEGTADVGGNILNGQCKFTSPPTPPNYNDATLGPPPPPPCFGGLKNNKCESFDTGLSALGIAALPTDPNKFITSLVSVILGMSGGIAVLLIIIAGYRIMTSQGKPEALNQAREQLMAAIVGLLFLIFSFVILQVIINDILQIPGGTATPGNPQLPVNPALDATACQKIALNNQCGLAANGTGVFCGQGSNMTGCAIQGNVGTLYTCDSTGKMVSFTRCPNQNCQTGIGAGTPDSCGSGATVHYSCQKNRTCQQDPNGTYTTGNCNNAC